MELVALKVKITRESVRLRGREQVRNRYPDFNALPSEVRTLPGRGPMDWAFYLDQVGWGWLYDQASGFGFADEENPDPLVLYGVIGVPVDFAEAAEDHYPDLCSIMEPADFLAWREARAFFAVPEVVVDTEAVSGALAALQLARELGDPDQVAECEEHARAVMDPDQDRVRGRRRNTNKDWATFADRRGIKLRGRRAGAAPDLLDEVVDALFPRGSA